MTLYSLALFLHIVGALLLFTALTIEGIGLRQVRHASTAEEVRDAAGISGLGRFVGPASVVLIAVPGLYMTATTWGWRPWILTGLAVWLLVAISGAVNGIRLAAIASAATKTGDVLDVVRARAGHPLLVTAWLVRSAAVLSVVFLMTTKPGAAQAVLTVSAAAVLGLVASLPWWRSSRTRAVGHAT